MRVRVAEGIVKSAGWDGRRTWLSKGARSPRACPCRMHHPPHPPTSPPTTATHLIDEEDPWNQLGGALVYILVHHAVHLLAQLVRDLRLLGLQQLAHEGHDVLPALGLGVGGVQVVQRNILDQVLLLVHISLWEGDVDLRLQIELGGIGVAPGRDGEAGEHRERTGADPASGNREAGEEELLPQRVHAGRALGPGRCIPIPSVQEAPTTSTPHRPTRFTDPLLASM